MSEYSQKGPSDMEDSANMCCRHGKHSILAFNIYDECKQKLCDCCGPSISEEPCECIIMENFDYPCEFGRFIFPGCPITLPDQVSKVKIVDDSFKVKCVGVMVTEPSKVKKGYWDVEVQIKYEYKLRFYDYKMRPLTIKCLPMKNLSEEDCGCTKDYMCASVCCSKTYTLYGGEDDSPVVATDLFCNNDCNGWPHAMVKLKSYPLDTSIVCVNECDCCDCCNCCDCCDCCNCCDCCYEECIRYVYIKMGSYMLLYLYRIESLLIESKGFSVPEDYAFPDWSSCEQFMQSDFWEDQKF